jgi:PAS domain S-box-containing protein
MTAGLFKSCLAAAAFAAAYGAMAELSRLISMPATGLATLWLPNGLYVAVLLGSECRRWPGLIAGALSGQLASDVFLHGQPVWLGLGFAAAHTVESGLSAALLRGWFGAAFSLARLRPLSAFIAVAGLGSPVLGGGLAAALVRAAGGPDLWATWPLAWSAQAVGVLIAGPLAWRILTPFPPASALSATAWIEGPVAVAAVAAGTWWVFHHPPPGIHLYLLLPLFLWVVLRGGFFGVAAALPAFAAFAVPAVLAEPEPLGWAAATPGERVWLAQSLVLAFATTFLAVAAVFLERCAAETQLQQSHRALEGRITQRTAALLGANERLRETEAAERARRRWWQALLRSLDDGVVTTDEHGRVTFLNEAAETLTGWSLGRASRQPLADVLPLADDGGAPLAGWLAQFIRDGESTGPVSVRLHRADGRALPVEYSVSSIRDEQSLPAGAVLIIRDITERQRTEQALREADRRKDEFVAMLAHELRNPLAPIRNAVQVLRRLWPDDPELRKARDVIDRQVAQMAHLLDDLLDVSRITRGLFVLQKETVNLAAVVERSVETSRPALDERRHTLRVVLLEQPVQVEGDPVRLVQVVSNLLNNAAKYTEPGGLVELTVETGETEAVLRVCDNGMGIPAELLPRVFELFTQGYRSLDRSQGGLGLGLPLVRRITELHGGAVEVRSDGPGRGAEFVVRLPRRPRVPGAEPRLPVPAAALPAGPAGKRVLVVDDNVDAAETLALFLRLDGREVRMACDGPGALDAAREFKPEAIFLDIGLPGMDGYEVARRLRALPDFRTALLVAVTGYGQEDSRTRSRAAGFDHHLVKPVDPESLSALLDGPA